MLDRFPWLGRRSYLPAQAVWPWTSYLISLHHNFLTYKMKIIIIVSTSWDRCEVVYYCQWLSVLITIRMIITMSLCRYCVKCSHVSSSFPASPVVVSLLRNGGATLESSDSNAHLLNHHLPVTGGLWEDKSKKEFINSGIILQYQVSEREKQEDLGCLVTILTLSPILLLFRPLNPDCSLQDIPQTSLKTLQECHAYFLCHEKANIT